MTDLDLIKMFPPFSGGSPYQVCVGKRIIYHPFCLPVKNDLPVQPLCSHTQAEDLAKRTGYLERRTGLLQSLAGQQEVGKMVRRAVRDFGKFFLHLLGFLIGDDTECAPMRSTLKYQLLAVNLFSGIQLGRLNLSSSDTGNIGINLGNTISFRNSRNIVETVVPCYDNRRHFPSFGEFELDGA